MDRVLVVACGALAKELRHLIASFEREEGSPPIDLECLPAKLHNRPELIPEAVRERVRAARNRYGTILVGYADCGTGGLLDKVCREEGVERLPGPHCYELYVGAEAFTQLQEQELGTLYLTDYLVRHFERLILEGLGILDHPELQDVYFNNYTRLVYLSQESDPELDRLARQAADRLGLRFEKVATGYGGLVDALVEIRERAA
ncbi:MAG: DUF1638 domain-containing protein [Acidimicrobiia bacterium]|nr:DUF1638 domain-containing protein [Acidimicrobiia bacterium]MYE74101.1 DUF1638 domain-containing protein [Acidimicrobiia bacterium]MYJ63834.1 DUF1638 domain-containing protein [Acidimicrobiia bacterium]